MNKRRGIIVAIVALAAAAALFRVHPAAEASRASVPAAPVTASEGRRSGAASAQLVVYVVGAVVRSGVYRLRPGARVEAAIRASGGTTAQADLIGVNLAERLHDGQEIVVPERGSPRAAELRTSKCGPHRRTRKTASGGRVVTRVDINRADAAELATLPGIGPRLAERIVVFRERNGPFAALDELLDVNGVSDKLVAAIEPYVNLSS